MNQNKEIVIQRTRIGEVIAYISISVMLFVDIVLQSSLLQYKYDIVSLTSHIALVTRTLMIIGFFLEAKRITKKELLSLTILGFIVVGSFLKLRVTTFFDLFFIPIAFENLNYRKIVNTFFYTILACFLIVIMLYYGNILPEYSVYREGSNTVRTTLGFTHPNVLGQIIFTLCALFTLKCDNKLKVWHLIVFSVVAIWIFLYPNSIAATLLLVLLILAVAVTMLYKRLFNKDFSRSLLFKIVSISIIPLLLLTIYILIFYVSDSEAMNSYFITLYHRFLSAIYAFNEYGIHLFGSKLNFVGTAQLYFNQNIISQNYFVIDCLYFLLPLRYGIIPSIYFIVIYYWGIIKSIRVNNTYMVIVIVLVAIYSISESIALQFYSSFILIGPCCHYIKNMENDRARKKGKVYIKRGQINENWNRCQSIYR